MPHSSRSYTTAPRILPDLNYFFEIQPFYTPTGKLAGIVAIDAAHNLKFYGDETFANSRTLLQGINSVASRQINWASSLSSIPVNPTYDFVYAANALYRIDYSGTISPALFNFHSEPLRQTADADNLYFVDIELTGAASTSVQHVLKVSLDGQTPAQIVHSFSYPTNHGPSVYPLASTGTTLLIEKIGDTDPGTGATVNAIEAIQLATPGTSTVLATLPNYAIPGPWLDNKVFITFSQGSYTAPMEYHTAYSTEILQPDGTLAQSLLPQSAFVSSGNSAYQVRDIAAAGLGGGTLYHLDSSGGPGTPVLRPDGSPFIIPANGKLDAAIGVESLTPQLDIASAPTPNGAIALTIDPVHNVIRTIQIPGSHVGWARSF